MKTNSFISSLIKWLLVLPVFLLSSDSEILGREIKNGYSISIIEVNKSLENLHYLLSTETVRGDKSKIRKLEKYLSNLRRIKAKYVKYYNITAKLINEMRRIDPDLYRAINSIKDKEGNLTDIFIKVIPLEGNQIIRGSTNVKRFQDSNNICLSNYGIKSVSVVVVDHQKALFLLAHEFGHLRYIVPNLAEYEEYYNSLYKNCNFHAKSIGHKDTDLSGKSADLTVKNFRQQYYSFRNRSKILYGKRITFNLSGTKRD